MPEIVADPPVAESPAAPAAVATPDIEDAATLLKRLAGKDQAYTRLKAEREAETAELLQLRKTVREAELAKMTDVEQATARLRDLETQLASARAEATREKLARKFPTAFEALGDSTPLDESVLEKLETRLKAQVAETDDEPYVDPNSPRRTTPRAKARTVEDARNELIALGNPYASNEWGD